MYSFGIGVPQDDVRAASLLRKACDLGYTQACR